MGNSFVLSYEFMLLAGILLIVPIRYSSRQVSSEGMAIWGFVSKIRDEKMACLGPKSKKG